MQLWEKPEQVSVSWEEIRQLSHLLMVVSILLPVPAEQSSYIVLWSISASQTLHSKVTRAMS